MVALTDGQLAELTVDLQQLQQRLQQQLNDSEQQSKPVELDQQSFGRVSRIDAIQQQQMAKASRQQNALLLNRVELALQAIAAGDYGYCRECDKPIGYARLKVKPDSPLCVQCQSANE